VVVLFSSYFLRGLRGGKSGRGPAARGGGAGSSDTGLKLNIGTGRGRRTLFSWSCPRLGVFLGGNSTVASLI